MHHTMGDFKMPQGDGLPRKTLLKELNTGRDSNKKLPKISFSLQEDTEEDSLSQVTQHRMPSFPTGPKLNNPLLPIHLNRDLSSLTSPISRKFELPPQATIAFFDEKEKVVKAATDQDMNQNPSVIGYTPKWTKVSHQSKL